MKRLFALLLLVSLVMGITTSAFAMNKSELVDRLAERYESVKP